jgi:hypothetical protein
LGLFGLALSHVKFNAATIRQVVVENGQWQFTSTCGSPEAGQDRP